MKLFNQASSGQNVNALDKTIRLGEPVPWRHAAQKTHLMLYRTGPIVAMTLFHMRLWYGQVRTCSRSTASDCDM